MIKLFKQIFCKHEYKNAYTKHHAGIGCNIIITMDVCKKCLNVRITAEYMEN